MGEQGLESIITCQTIETGLKNEMSKVVDFKTQPSRLLLLSRSQIFKSINPQFFASSLSKVWDSVQSVSTENRVPNTWYSHFGQNLTLWTKTNQFQSTTYGRIYGRIYCRILEQNFRVENKSRSINFLKLTRLCPKCEILSKV